jgi:hypothetical protein
MFGPVDQALAKTITDAIARRAEPTITRIEFAPGHGDARLTDATVAAKWRVMNAAPQLLEAAQAAWNCIAELPPTQARVEVAQLLQAAIEQATGATE